jgi:hypothetical protein
MKRLKYFFPFLAVFLFQGCIQQIALNSMSGILDNGMAAFNEESDLQLAHEALGSNLKLIEALVKSDTTNKQFLVFAAEGYQGYGLAFCEDDSLERARIFYLRGRDYGLRALKQNSKFRAALDGSLEDFQASLQTFSKDDVPALFWTAFNWGSYINISKNDVEALAEIGKVTAMVQRSAELDPGYYHGGAYLFFATIEGSVPKVLGGNPEKAKAMFEKCLVINEGKFLMTQLYYAKTVAVAMQDQPLFESLLKQIEDASIDILPEARFANVVAKEKARKLLAKENELF